MTTVSSSLSQPDPTADSTDAFPAQGSRHRRPDSDARHSLNEDGHDHLIRDGHPGFVKIDPDQLIFMRGIVKTYNEGKETALTVLHGIDFDTRQGEFVSIVGPSGCGKSTLMNLIGMLDKPNHGGYAFNGEDILRKNDNELSSYRSQNIGFIFQNFNLVGRINALQNVAMPMMYAGVGKKERDERAAELLDIVGMGDRLTHAPNELSGGQKQRVAIARSLANDPDLLLADEPTGALDSQTGRMVMDLFHRLNQDYGKAIVFITHNPELASETERIVEMKDGHVVDVRRGGAA